jgi:imidazolonepropionase-like amidohydrolase
MMPLTRRSLIIVLGGLVALLLVSLALFWLNAGKTREIINVQKGGNTPTIIKNVRVFNGVEARLTPYAGVQIEHGIITKLYQSGDDLPNSMSDQEPIHIVDGQGGVLMPAFIDFHAHFGMSSGRPPWDSALKDLYPLQYEYDAYLYAGVTSIVHASPIVESPFSKIKHGPRVYKTGKIITAKDGHPIPMMKSLIPWPMSMMAIKNLVLQIDPNGIDFKALNALFDDKAHHTKIVIDGVIPLGSPKLSPEKVAKIIAVSHKHGQPVYVHAAAASDAYNAVLNGADVLMHPAYQGKFDDKMLKLLEQKQTPVVTTAQIWEWMIRGKTKKPPITPLERRLMAPGTYASLMADWTEGIENYGKYGFTPSYVNKSMPQFDENLLSNIRAMQANNILMIAGTDYGVPGLTPGASLIRELHYLNALGMSNLKVLKMATSLPGKILEPKGPALGVIKQGALAEMILLSDNPVENLDAIDHVKMIFTQGYIITPIPLAGSN